MSRKSFPLSETTIVVSTDGYFDVYPPMPRTDGDKPAYRGRLSELGAGIRGADDRLAVRPSSTALAEAVILWSAYAALLWCVPQVLTGRPALRCLAWTIFIVGAVVAIVGISAYYGLRPVRHGDPFGPYTNYNHAASIMVMSLFAGLGLFFARLGSLFREGSMSKRLSLTLAA